MQLIGISLPDSARPITQQLTVKEALEHYERLDDVFTACAPHACMIVRQSGRPLAIAHPTRRVRLWMSGHACCCLVRYDPSEMEDGQFRDRLASTDNGNVVRGAEEVQIHDANQLLVRNTLTGDVEACRQSVMDVGRRILVPAICVGPLQCQDVPVAKEFGGVVLVRSQALIVRNLDTGEFIPDTEAHKAWVGAVASNKQTFLRCITQPQAHKTSNDAMTREARTAPWEAG